MALLAWGEGWHNNHHAFPYSAAFGLRWYEFDPGYLFIRLGGMPIATQGGPLPLEGRKLHAHTDWGRGDGI